ncbi:hypothetical protein RHOSPDRAFT_33022 [Rhodotorula sp. JG-1b]|nr:hypothetical protein RHOSPDRAFT_33022 [Rhodotorula sp. JG-1b]
MTSRTASPALSTATVGGAGAGTATTRKGTGGGGGAADAAPARTTTPAAKTSAASTASSSSPVTTNPSSPALGPVRDLSKLLNLPLRIGLVSGGAADSAAGAGGPKSVVGSLFTYDSSFVVLALASSRSPASAATSPSTSPLPGSQPTRGEKESGTPKRTFTFLRTSQITSVTVLSSTPTDLSLPSASSTSTSTSSLPPLPSTAADLTARVDRAVAEDRRARARLAPAGAAPAAQGLYDALAKTLPVRWAGKSIVVLDEVVIESPYEPQNVKGGKGSAERVERVKKMVEGLRTRLGMTTPAAA